MIPRSVFFGFVILLSLTFFTIPCISFADVIHGVFMVVKGDVSVKNTKQAKQKVKVGDKVFPGDVVETGIDSRAKIVMTDRNVINISPETHLEIQKYENAGDNKNVEMNLLQGKVRNNVEQKYDGDKNKFIVKTPTAVAGVRGTQFFTSFDPATRITSVVTLRGAVSLAPVSVSGALVKPVLIQKGESTTMSPGANPEPPKPMPKEELKKIDQESTVSSAPSKQEVSKDTAKSDKKSDEKKDDKKSEPAKEATTSSPASGDTAANKNPDVKEKAPAPGAEPANANTNTASNGPNGDSGANKKGPAPANGPEAPSAGGNNAPANNRGPASVDPTASTNGPQQATPSPAASAPPTQMAAMAPAPTAQAPNSMMGPAVPMAAMAPLPTPFKMVDIGDKDLGQFKQILPPTSVSNAPKPPPPVLVNTPVTTPTPPPAVNDIIRGTNGKARVIVIPVQPR